MHSRERLRSGDSRHRQTHRFRSALLLAVCSLLFASPASALESGDGSYPSPEQSQELATAPGSQPEQNDGGGAFGDGTAKAGLEGPSSSAYLDLYKSADGDGSAVVSPSTAIEKSTFTFDFSVRCQQADCVDVVLRDTLPSDLQGFKILGLTYRPVSIPAELSWFEGGQPVPDRPSYVGEETTFELTIKEPLGDNVGLGVGKTFSAILTLEVPGDITPKNLPNGGEFITNRATAEGSNVDSTSATARVAVTTEKNLAAGVSKRWLQGEGHFGSGNDSTVELEVRNNSNVPVDEVVLQDPRLAPDHAAALEENNPFRYLNFAGFTEPYLPIPGAETVRVDAYVWRDTQWIWVEGEASDAQQSPNLPEGVSASEVGGVRLTFMGAGIASYEPGAVSFAVEVRGSERNTMTSFATDNAMELQNTASAYVVDEGVESPHVEDSAIHRLLPAQLSASITKSSPIGSSVVPGVEWPLTIDASNTGDPVESLVVTDYDPDAPFFHSDGLEGPVFRGFADIRFPNNAESQAEAVFYGSTVPGGPVTQATVSFQEGTVPQPPEGFQVAGFALSFTAQDGGISENSHAIIAFNAATDKDFDDFPGGAKERSFVNTARVEVCAEERCEGADGASVTVRVLKPEVSVDADKTITPASGITRGMPVVAELKATTEVTASGDVQLRKVVLEDVRKSPDSDNEFWNSFTFTSLQPTQVPSGASLTVQYQTKEAPHWVDLESWGGQETDWYASIHEAELEDRLAPVSPDAITAVRLIFESGDHGMGDFGEVRAYLGFTARTNLRNDESKSVGTPDGTNVENWVNASAEAVTTPGAKKTDFAEGSALVRTVDPEPPGGGGKDPSGAYIRAAKTWENTRKVASFTKGDATARLGWAANPGSSDSAPFDEVVITDFGASTDGGVSKDDSIKNSVFNSFDFVEVFAMQRYAPSLVPYSNLWYLLYDKVSKVELYYDDQWNEQTPPVTGWKDLNNLTHDGEPRPSYFTGIHPDQNVAAKTLGIRLTVVPDDDVRNCAYGRADDVTPGFSCEGIELDPYAPSPGTGIITSNDAAERFLTARFQVRDRTRVEGQPISSTTLLNSDEPGYVDNSVLVEGYRGDQPVLWDEASDTVEIVDGAPSMNIVKQIDGSSAGKELVVKPQSEAPSEQQPALTYTIDAQVSSHQPASTVRLIDHAPCEDADGAETCATTTNENPFLSVAGQQLPQSHPFNYVEITGISLSRTSKTETESFDWANTPIYVLRVNEEKSTYIDSDEKYYCQDPGDVTADPVCSELDIPGLDTVVGVAVDFNAIANSPWFVQDTQMGLTVSGKVRETPIIDEADYQSGETVTVTNLASVQGYDKRFLDATAQVKTKSVPLTLSGAQIEVIVDKKFNNSEISEPEAGNDQLVRFQAVPGSSNVPATELRLRDDVGTSREFWDHFDLTRIDSIVFPKSMDRVSIGVNGPFGPGGTNEWKYTEPTAKTDQGYELPVLEDQLSQVTGVEFVFSRSDEAAQEEPNSTWTTWGKADVGFAVRLREVGRFTGHDIRFLTGGTMIENAVEATVRDATGLQDTDSATDTLTLISEGHEIQIGKSPIDPVASVGDLTGWNITIKNTGESSVYLSSLTDQPDEYLAFTGLGSCVNPYGGDNASGCGAYSYYDAAGQKRDDAVSVDTNQDGELVFTWTAGNKRLRPGEEVVLQVWFELQPGLGEGDRATNTVSIRTEDDLEDCFPFAGETGSGAVVFDPSKPQQCSTDNTVTPSMESNVIVTKGVRGFLDDDTNGAVNYDNPLVPCTKSLSSVAFGDFYRAPCVARSQVGGKDTWLLRMTNVGVKPITKAWLFDVIPFEGDHAVIGEGARGSGFHPVLTGDLAISTVGDAETSLEVTTVPEACDDIGGQDDKTIGSEAAPCANATWLPWEEYRNSGEELGDIYAVRVGVSFTDGAGLANGESVEVRFSTENLPQSESYSAGADINVPDNPDEAKEDILWNQFGSFERQSAVSGGDVTTEDSDDCNGCLRRLVSGFVGVSVSTGPLVIHKEAEGPADYPLDDYPYPNSVNATVSCAVEGVPVTWGDSQSKTKSVVLQWNSTLKSYKPARLEGIPTGAECSVSEDGALGDYGEVDRNSPGPVVIRTTDQPPAEVTLVNSYEWQQPGLPALGGWSVVAFLVAGTLLLGVSAGGFYWSRRPKERGRHSRGPVWSE